MQARSDLLGSWTRPARTAAVALVCALALLPGGRAEARKVQFEWPEKGEIPPARVIDHPDNNQPRADFFLRMPGVKGRCEGHLVYGSGEEGHWRVKCPDGSEARGRFERIGDGVLRGRGLDDADREVRFLTFESGSPPTPTPSTVAKAAPAQPVQPAQPAQPAQAAKPKATA